MRYSKKQRVGVKKPNFNRPNKRRDPREKLKDLRIAIIVPDGSVNVNERVYHIPNIHEYIDEEIYAIQWYGGWCEIEYVDRLKPNEFTEDFDFLIDLIDEHTAYRQVLKKRKTDPLFGYKGDELREKKRELDQKASDNEFRENTNRGELVVDTPQGEKTFSLKPSKIMMMFLWCEAATALLDQSVDFYDINDEIVRLTTPQAKAVLAKLIAANRDQVHAKVNRDREIRNKGY